MPAFLPHASQAPGAAQPEGCVVLEARAIAKSFGPVQALRDVWLTLRAGAVHTLLGENGAGKSTLMKILAGIHQPDCGQLLLDGRELRLDGPGQARARGIAIVHQEPSLAANLSVADNLFANRPPQRAGWIDERALHAASRELLARLRIAIDPQTPVAQLSMARRQLVEIAKALNQPARIVIMDEPTSSLSDSEAEILFSIISGLREQGKAIVYISHRMPEVMRISDQISVLRDGRYICTLARAATSAPALIALMVGRPLQQLYPQRSAERPCPGPAALLRVQSLGCARRFQGVNLELHAGEILGVFGLIGAGRSDLLEALFGLHRCSGRMLLEGREFRPKSPADAIASGVAFVTENRLQQGLVPGQSVLHNITMVHQGRRRAWLTDARAEAALARSCVQRLGIRIAGLHQPVRELSGGNQQKVVFAKWLALAPRLLLLDEPTRGVDVGARFGIYTLIRELAAAGAAVILVSSELAEVMAMSDRLLVMREKRQIATLDVHKLREQTVMAYATGAAPA